MACSQPLAEAHQNLSCRLASVWGTSSSSDARRWAVTDPASLPSGEAAQAVFHWLRSFHLSGRMWQLPRGALLTTSPVHCVA